MVDYNSPEEVAKRASQEDPIVMYLVVRESLGMSIGKTAAQCAHASQMLLLQYQVKKTRDTSYGVPHTTDPEMGILVVDESRRQQLFVFEEWLNSSFRKVVLKADEKEWAKLKTECQDRVIVIDAGLTELQPGTETVIGLWPMKKSQVPKLVRRLQVLK